MTQAKSVLSALAIMLFAVTAGAMAQSKCLPFGGTIYGWHNVDKAWHGVGDFTFGKKILHATVEDPNTGFKDLGDIWLGTEEATFTFAEGDKVTLMTSFVTEHQTDPGGSTGVYHVNETGYFARGSGRFKNAWGRFNLQGPFGPSVVLPDEIKPGPNDGLFWIGQYNGTICGVKEIVGDEE
ncbi:MAG TPA: hypothetical protein VJQ82_01690 [Terriglobales bacterium]|nr:hypothetical protein [Terriglobales bacterium]